jgi:glycosyltransferase involved in cell wall biosynthesis
VETHVVDLHRYLDARGVRVEVANITRHRGASGGGVHYPSSAGALLALMWRLRPRVVHLHVGGTMPPRVVALALACTLLPGTRNFLTLHSGGFASSPHGVAARSWHPLAAVLRRFDGVFGVNAEMDRLFARLGVPAHRRHLVVPFAPPTDLATFDEVRRERPDIAAFVEARRPLLVSVGQLEPEYDVPVQVAALERIRERHATAGLLVVGPGRLRPELEALIRERALTDQSLLTGDVPRRLTLRLLADADVVLRPTWYDGDAISVREALYLGTPVVASDTGMRPEGVLLTPPRDAEALAEVTLAALAQPRRTAERPPLEADHLAGVLAAYGL